MSSETCSAGLEEISSFSRSYVCIACGRPVCGDHSKPDRIEPKSGATGRACDRCVATKTIASTTPDQFRWLYQQQAAASARIETELREVKDDLARIIAALQEADRVEAAINAVKDDLAHVVLALDQTDRNQTHGRTAMRGSSAAEDEFFGVHSALPVRRWPGVVVVALGAATVGGALALAVSAALR